MDKFLVGIDLGTSSLKLVCLFKSGVIVQSQEKYEEPGCLGWWNAVKRALRRLASDAGGRSADGRSADGFCAGGRCADGHNAEGVGGRNTGGHYIEGIGLTSQVGTYIVDKEGFNKTHSDINRRISGYSIAMWNNNNDNSYLDRLLGHFSQEEFIREITMLHPPMLSYPAPKIMQLQDEHKNIGRIFQPKDFLCEMLTGNMATDMYSWRGLADLQRGAYSEKLLDFTGFNSAKLPPIYKYSDCCGAVTAALADELGLPKGLPVYVGCNDFYASLIGMGIWNGGDAFDITGTSEHIGTVTDSIDKETRIINGAYLNKNVKYGVTASSGASLDWARRLFGAGSFDIGEIIKNKPPVFLPYLTGERAPVWDSGARGVFFGIHDKTGDAEMKYAVLEGVCFSLYHIWQYIKATGPTVPVRTLRASGGAAKDGILNALKAEIFDMPVVTMETHSASALGAALMASVGAGWYHNINDAMSEMCVQKDVIEPKGAYRNILMRRFDIYRNLYPLIKDEFKALEGING